MMICGLVLFYSINLILMTTAFWLVRLDNLMILSDTLFSIARTPIDIFRRLGPVAPFVLTYIIPLAFLAAMPVKLLFGRVSIAHTLGESAGLAFIFLAIAVLSGATPLGPTRPQAVDLSPRAPEHASDAFDATICIDA